MAHREFVGQNGGLADHRYPSYPVWFLRIFLATVRREAAELARYRMAELDTVRVKEVAPQVRLRGRAV